MDGIRAHGMDGIRAHGMDGIRAHGMDGSRAHGMDGIRAHGMDGIQAQTRGNTSYVLPCGSTLVLVSFKGLGLASRNVP
eukprot:358649-Chlamydomonas_euryale.AAC.6